MTWIFIFLLIVTGLIILLLIAPFYLEINSNKGLYGARYSNLIAARLLIEDSSLKVGLKIMWWEKQFDLLAASGKSKPVEKKKNTKNTKTVVSLDMIKSIIRSFRVNECIVSIDTGNMPLNGILYPCLYMLRLKTRRNIEINFFNNNEIVLEIENNLGRILRIFIYYLFILKSKKNGKRK